jgi:hypothetical protein
MSKAKQIIGAYKNVIRSAVGLTSDQEEELFTARLEICHGCHFGENKITCKSCGCPLIAKTKSETSTCPIDKW